MITNCPYSFFANRATNSIAFSQYVGYDSQYYNMLASAERLIELEDLPQEECFDVPYVCDYQNKVWRVRICPLLW